MKKSILFLLSIVAVIASCSRSQGSLGTIRNGDLIFVGQPHDYRSDSTSMDSAIADATGDGKLNLIHVAIAEVDRDSIWVIDATVKHGVDRHPLDTFLRDFTLKDGSEPVFLVKRLDGYSPRQIRNFVENAKAFIGEEYDHTFLPDNGKHYCSELVRDSYISKKGEYIFDSAPMNFKDSEGNMPVYWEQLFAKLNMPVPQGVEGTNPQDMSQSSALVTVSEDYRFW